MRVKILKKVPLMNDIGEPYTPEIGTELEVTQDVGDALLRGGDAASVATPTKADAGARTESAQIVLPKPSRRTKKNRGGAPENK